MEGFINRWAYDELWATQSWMRRSDQWGLETPQAGHPPTIAMMRVIDFLDVGVAIAVLLDQLEELAFGQPSATIRLGGTINWSHPWVVAHQCTQAVGSRYQTWPCLRSPGVTWKPQDHGSCEIPPMGGAQGDEHWSERGRTAGCRVCC